MNDWCCYQCGDIAFYSSFLLIAEPLVLLIAAIATTPAAATSTPSGMTAAAATERYTSYLNYRYTIFLSPKPETLIKPLLLSKVAAPLNPEQ